MFPAYRLGEAGSGKEDASMGEAFATATAFAQWLIDGRGKSAFWTKRARGLAAAAYQAAQLHGEEGEACNARALDLLRTPEAVLLERLGRSIAVGEYAGRAAQPAIAKSAGFDPGGTQDCRG